MKRRRGMLVAALTLLTLGSSLVAAPAQADPGIIDGFAADWRSGNSLQGVCVSAYEAGSDTPAGTGCSDAQGSWSIPGLVDGTAYELHHTGLPGYVAGWVGLTPDRETAFPVTAPSFQGLYLHAGTPVSGTVRKADGTPASGVRVTLVPTESEPDDDQWWQTNESGRWIIWTEPGEYTLRNELLAQRWYWKDTYVAADAEVIHVGDSHLVLDQTVPAPTTVTGTVRDTDGDPVAGVCVAALDAEGTRHNEVCTDEAGGYRLIDLPAGSWVLEARDQALRYATARSAPFTIRDGQTLSGIDLTVVVAGSLSGRAVDRVTGAPLDSICATAYGRNGNPIDQQVGCSGPDGNWKITGLPAGAVTVHLDGDATHQERWAADAESQSNATVYQVRDAATTSVGTVRLVRGATVTGVVRAPNGRPLADAWVTLGPYDARDGGNGRWSGQTDSHGRYTITNAPPGKRPALVHADDYAWQWSGQASDPGRATKLDLRAGATTTFDARLAPQGVIQVNVIGAVYGEAVRPDAHTVPSQAPIGVPTDQHTIETPAVSGLPAAPVKISVQVWDSRSAVYRTLWYGGSSYADAKPVVARPGVATTVTVTLR